jgi:KaiC/GvpD/RAD55 family RecA-like ATPase
METLTTGYKWIDDILPNGLTIKTSTIITGPGGSGKPLIGETFVSAWLKKGGSVIFMLLQYPSTDFIAESIKEITGINLDDYKSKIIFIQLDVDIPGIVIESENVIRANLVKPEVWTESLNLAENKLTFDEPGILVFGSALNLLLYSPTYAESILNKIIKTIVDDKSKTFIFSVSTTAKAEQISKIESVADNLIFSRSEKKPFKLYIKVLRLNGQPYNSKEVTVDIPETTIKHIKKIADHSRSKIIPAISNI